MSETTKTEAQRILDAASTPRDRSEERHGIDADVIAMRIMLSAGTQAARDLALRMAARAVA